MKQRILARRRVLAAGLLMTGPPVMAGAYEDAVSRTWRHSTAGPSLRELARYATLAPNGHNTQPWKFQLRPDGVDILADLSRRTPVVDPDDHHLWVSLGCAAENLALAAAAFGFRSAMRISARGVHMDLASAPAAETPLYRAIPQRQSTRGEYEGRPLQSGELRQLEQAGAADNVALVLLTDRAKIDRVRDLVIAGNTAQIADAAFVRELKEWIRFSESEAIERGDGLFAGSSGSPAAPRWIGSLMFSLFFTARSENDKYATQLRSSAGVAVFAASQADPAGWVAVGRSCQRFLLQATALDIRTAFVNQPVEVKALRSQLAAEASFGDKRPDLVVRFGRGPKLPPSLRRPLEAVVMAG